MAAPSSTKWGSAITNGAKGGIRLGLYITTSNSNTATALHVRYGYGPCMVHLIVTINSILIGQIQLALPEVQYLYLPVCLVVQGGLKAIKNC